MTSSAAHPGPVPFGASLLTSIEDRLRAGQDEDLSGVPDALAQLLRALAVPLPVARRRLDELRRRAGALDGLAALFADAESTRRLRDYFMARVLGPTRHRMATLSRWAAFAEALAAIPAREADPACGRGDLMTHALPFEGVPLQFTCPPGNVISPFLERQYFLERDGLRIRPEAGDLALDLGAGIGDSALAFGAAVGPTGSVWCFEPMRSERDLLAINLQGNGDLGRRTRVFDRAMSGIDGQPVGMTAAGTGSRLAPEGSVAQRTATIDAIVLAERPRHVDFIKMDIEGAELAALHGARDTLNRFQPRLAVCIYHGWQIFEVCAYLRSTLPGYRFHLETHSPTAMETVLYGCATPADRPS